MEWGEEVGWEVGYAESIDRLFLSLSCLLA